MAEVTLTTCDECNWSNNQGWVEYVPEDVFKRVQKLTSGRGPIVVYGGGSGPKLETRNGREVPVFPVYRGATTGTREEAARHDGWTMDDNLDLCPVCVAERQVGDEFHEENFEEFHGGNAFSDYLTDGAASQVQQLVMVKVDPPKMRPALKRVGFDLLKQTVEGDDGKVPAPGEKQA